ncbi:unnamed protein product [Rhizophagus irregularis]|nr:unnamed protein product [Rhizophagus irregularis]
MGFRPLFPRNASHQYDTSEGMYNWDEEMEQPKPLQGPSSYAEAAKKIKTTPNARANVSPVNQNSSQPNKGKGKQQETHEPARKPWNQQNLNSQCYTN